MHLCLKNPERFVIFTAIFAISVLLSSCKEEGIFEDAEYKQEVLNDFEERQQITKDPTGNLYTVFEDDLSMEEEEGLKFLYAYMPLCDLVEYDGEFFLENVRSSLEAREIFPWGKQIPAGIFLHFVLPVRANNEYLDSSRMVFLEELRNRIAGMDMEEAALEVNHWCHEKVCYKPTDGRTSAPLSTIRTSWGRCGEESVLTVAAMRSVGIPARQVYTPRWAHSDDNHAWVEVWINGSWHYLGACEPEPVLDMGWFTEPARRAMLLHTRVFGNYSGDEEIVLWTKNYSELNITANYAETKKIFVKVMDEDLKEVKGARVDFGLYNYAEFYPLGKKLTDENGLASLSTGYGDLLIWVSHEGDFGSRKVIASESDTVKIRLDCIINDTDMEIFSPPAAPEPFIVDNALKEENARSLKEEDSIRAIYMETFMDSSKVNSLIPDHEMAENSVEYLINSMGNSEQILRYISDNDIPSTYLFDLLGVISAKDLRDAKAETLSDHLIWAERMYDHEDVKAYSEDIFVSYVLNPRVSTEHLGAYRRVFQVHFQDFLAHDYNARVAALEQWITGNIAINQNDNHYNIPISPLGVFHLKVADERSRDIFFVSLCRSLGIAARLDPALRQPQYYDEGWKDASFAKKEEEGSEKALLDILAGQASAVDDPLYRIHFSLAKLEDGRFLTLDYDWEKPLSQFDEPLDLPPGTYRLLSARRKEGGDVITKMLHFELAPGDHIAMEVNIPSLEIKPIGKLDFELEFMTVSGENLALGSLSEKGKTAIVWIDPALEPSRHVINEYIDNTESIGEWQGTWYFITTHTDQQQSPVLQELKKSGAKMLNDPGQESLKSLKISGLMDENAEFPVILVVDKDGNIYYKSTGYSVGLVNRIKAL